MKHVFCSCQSCLQNNNSLPHNFLFVWCAEILNNKWQTLAVEEMGQKQEANKYFYYKVEMASKVHGTIHRGFWISFFIKFLFKIKLIVELEIKFANVAIKCKQIE
jgi:hypothetical protein